MCRNEKEYRSMYEGDFSLDDRPSLMETILKWVQEQDLRSRGCTYKGGLVTALSVIRWAQVNNLGDREFAEAMIKQLVTSFNTLGDMYAESIRNDPGPCFIVSHCPNCGKSPIEIKKDGG